MNVIEVNDLTKKYAFGKGIFNVSFNVKEGEVVGFLGPNGAGKSTTMRHLMGFSIPDEGYCKINNYDCYKEYFNAKKEIGYLPGEVTLPQGLNGYSFIKMMEGLKEHKDDDRIKYLCDKFEMDLSQDIKRMSIGEKRKLAIISAFFSDPKVLLLDEPTSGLDPKMQDIFIDFIKEEKRRGKTILLSSHIFKEVEALCDRILIIKDGKIVSEVNKEDIKNELKKTFYLKFKDLDEYNKFILNDFEYKEKNKNELSLIISLNDDEIDKFIKEISNYNLIDFNEKTISLEDYFMKFYKTRGNLCLI